LRPFLPPLQDILPNTTYKVDKILDGEIIATSDGGIQRYLVHWKKASTDDAWIDHNAVERYEEHIYTRLNGVESSSTWGE